MKLFILLFSCISILSFSPVTTLAQATDKKYKEAVGYYSNGNYTQAMLHLAPLTQVQHKSSPISPYAHYYYTLAALEAKKLQEAYLMSRQLIERFPSWEKIDDAYYVHSITQFEKKSYAEALKTLRRVRNTHIIKDAQGLKQKYLNTITDLKTLKTLQQQFADDREVAYATIALIKSKFPTKENLQLADQLNTKFAITKTTSTPPAKAEKESKQTSKSRFDKGYLNVAVLLPFRLDQAGSSQHLRTTQYIIDYYQGLQLAQKQLAAEGIKVNLLAHDISNEPSHLENFYTADKNTPADLLIGPLYPKTYEKIVEYSRKNNVVVINPFATDGSLIDKNGNVFLAHPSMNLQASKMAEFTRKLGSDIHVAVYYGNSAKDSLMAVHYVNEIKSINGRILELSRIGHSAEEINQAITIDENKQPSQVILFSSNSGTGPALMNILSGRKLTDVKVISVGSAFNFQNNMAAYGHRLYIADADFADLNQPVIRQFQKKYFDATNTLPSVFSFQGYDQLLFFGRMLYRHQDKLVEGLGKKSNDKDYLLSGYDYSGNSRENKKIPILENRDGQWAQIN
jgi:ABC-type branched-subunit amino acid transport system substrate-binding protein